MKRLAKINYTKFRLDMAQGSENSYPLIHNPKTFSFFKYFYREKKLAKFLQAADLDHVKKIL